MSLKNDNNPNGEKCILKPEWKSNEKLTPELIFVIFNEIDEGQKGWLSEKDIENHLNKFRLPNADMQAKLLFKSLSHQSKISTGISLIDFVDFVKRREKTLMEIYSEVDGNLDGVITSAKLEKKLAQHSEIFADPSIAATASKALMSRMSVGGDESCSFREFSRVFLFMVEVDVNLVFNHWAKYSVIAGEDYSLPDEKSIEKSRANIFLSGAIAGCISRTTTAPLDRLKVIMQAGKGDATIVNMCRYMYQEGGFLGFWRGNGINCVKIAPESAAKFLCYDEFKNVITKYTGGDSMTPSLGEKFVAGASAGAVSQALVYPLEITKTRLALSTTGEYNSIFSVVAQIMKDNNGFKGLYRGLVPSVLGIVPYAGIDLMVFFTLKERWVASNRNSKQSTPGVLTLVRMQ